MKKLFILLAIVFIAITIQAQDEVVPAEVVTGSNSGDGELKAAITALNTADALLEDEIDTLKSPPHGFMSFQDSAFVIDITQSAFSKITNAGNDLFTVDDADGVTIAGDSLTIITPGTYIVMAGLSFSGTNGDVFEFAVFKNAVIASPKMERSTSATDIGAVPLPFYLESLVAGDDLSLRITNTASSDDATVVACSWITWFFHE